MGVNDEKKKEFIRTRHISFKQMSFSEFAEAPDVRIPLIRQGFFVAMCMIMWYGLDQAGCRGLHRAAYRYGFLLLAGSPST